MKSYQIIVYLTNLAFKGVVKSLSSMPYTLEKLYQIDICKKTNVNRTENWMGLLTDDLTCEEPYIDYYVQQKMSNIMTTTNFRTDGVNILYIDHTLFNSIINYDGIVVEISDNDTGYDNEIAFLIFVISFTICVYLLKIFILKICSAINNYKYQKRYKIKTIKFRETLNFDCSCTICLDEFKEDFDVNVLNCNHIFHKQCINEWIETKTPELAKCPNCNKYIFESDINEPLIF